MAKLSTAEVATIQSYRSTYPHQGQRTLAKTIIDRGVLSGRSFATVYNAIRRLAGSIGGAKAKATPAPAPAPAPVRESSAARC